MTRASRIAGLIALLAVAVASCSSGGDAPERAQTVEATTTTTAAGETTTTEGSIDQSQLDAALLTIEDVPPGYTEYTDPNADDDSSFCEGSDPTEEFPEIAKAEVQFSQGGETGPFIFDSVVLFAPGDAENFMQAVTDALTACQTFTQTDSDGTVLDVTLSPISFPSLGDQTLATNLTIDDGTLSALGDFVFVRNGDTVTYIATLGVGENDSTVTEAMARRAQEKLEALT